MFNEYPFGLGSDVGLTTNIQTLTACGYDRNCYISTAALAPSPYTSQPLIEARLGGLIKLIEACDDAQPPVGNFNDPGVQAVYNAIIQNVVTEINGYLSPIYPMPLMQTGTVAILKITGITDDGNGTVTEVRVLEGGNYLTAPATTNNPAYLRHIDPLCNENYWGPDWEWNQRGSGLQLTVTYENQAFTDENGLSVNAQTIDGTPTIATGGTGYCWGQLIVLTGGTSFVPAKLREAALVLICHSFYQRRLAPEEKNIFQALSDMWRGKGDKPGILQKIGNGDDGAQLDGTYKRFFSIGAMWGTKSVLFNANSL